MENKRIKVEDLEIKPEFEKRYKKLLKNNYQKFLELSTIYLRKSIRVNTLKISVNELKKRLEKKWILTKIPWHKDAFWIKYRHGSRRDIGNLIEHNLGYFYVQGAASMIPPLALDPQPGELILDMCAAPGSKTTQIGITMKNKGLLIANDYKGMRLKSLGINLKRTGLTNTFITFMKGQNFRNFKFDRILVDAPCSGTGTIRKSPKTLKIWNPNMVKRLAGTQKQLLENAFNNLKVGGTLVYSTCSLEPYENVAVVTWFLDKYPNVKLQNININIKRSKPITEFEGEKYHKEINKCLRIWPSDNDTEGFFVSKFKKI